MIHVLPVLPFSMLRLIPKRQSKPVAVSVPRLFSLACQIKCCFGNKVLPGHSYMTVFLNPGYLISLGSIAMIFHLTPSIELRRGHDLTLNTSSALLMLA